MGRILAALAAPVAVLLPWTAAGPALRLAALSAGLVLAARWAGYVALRAAYRSGHLTQRTLLVGAGQTGAQVAGLLGQHPELGLRACGFLDSSPLASGLTLPVLGTPADVGEVVGRYGIGRVIVCFPDGRDEELVPVLRACRELDTDICVVPRLHELGAAVPRACLDEIWGIPLIPLRHGRLVAGKFLKRAFDVAAAGILLALTAPLLAVLAAVIKLRRRHSVLFRQVRVTGSGRHAEIIKLRTLGEHSDADTCWVVPTRHVTPLGSWLRATHLDELPQLVNVLRGDMSLVGPRPGAAVLHRTVRTRDPPVRRPAPDACRAHRVGAGPRAPRRHLAPRACPFRQRLHRQLVTLARPGDLGQDPRPGRRAQAQGPHAVGPGIERTRSYAAHAKPMNKGDRRGQR